MQKKPKQDAKDASTASKHKMFPKPFGIDRQRIRIKANAEETLKGAFLPFTLGQHTCSIVFEDVSCGKFVYEITGDTSLPQPFNKFKFQVSACCLSFCAAPYQRYTREIYLIIPTDCVPAVCSVCLRYITVVPCIMATSYSQD